MKNKVQKIELKIRDRIPVWQEDQMDVPPYGRPEGYLIEYLTTNPQSP